MPGKSSWNGTRPRPKYLNLIQIRLPVPGLVSILHRVSGAVLFLLLPLLLALFELSLESVQTFSRFKAVFSHWAVKLMVLGVVWAYLHHLCAGIRHLALDLDYGTELAAARASSWAVLAISVAVTLVVGALIW
jgi:succinate dehydrogenase / fumarate reductase, cytochrome b subunit